MAEALGVALAVPGIVELCIKYGQSLVRKYQNYQNYETELGDLIVKFEAHWTNLRLQIEFFAKVQDRVEERHRLHFEKLVSVLSNKLKQIGLKIEGIAVHVKRVFRRAKFALMVQKSLQEAISELVEWQDLIQPLIFHLTKTEDPVVEQRINDAPTEENVAISTVQNMMRAFSSAKPPTKELAVYHADNNFWNPELRKVVRYSAVQIHRVPGNNGRQLLIDSIPCSGRDPTARRTIKDIRELVQVLRLVDPMTFGIPVCAGTVNVKDDKGTLSKIEMVFKVPANLTNPRSLRDILVSLDHRNDPINVRIQLAKRLARTVSFVHSSNFVHKNFRPETIVIFESRGQSNDQVFINEVGFPFLVGFQKFRSAATTHTTMMGDSAWERNLYRHPERQGEFPDEVYRMQHDIYSLGVCLLEIALWKSFVLYDDYSTPRRPEDFQCLDKKSGREVKEILVNMARELVPKTLGNRYAEVTISCLKCLDDDDGNDFDFMDEEGISVGVGYIERILGKLEEITV
ncbi:hypothetical protein DFP73DRAFT_95441 [Morchella snyderi]|nr:hypothetical protein DFP73DRAFT_95441 [Morchella snyderi]